MTQLDFTIYADEVVVSLKGFEDRLTDLKPAMRKVRDLLVEGNRKNFASRGSFFGEAWPGLAPETSERKARQGEPQDAMQRTGALLRALSGGRGRRTSATKTSARAGVALYYARFSMAGASGNRKGRQPARPVVGATTQQRREIASIISTYIDGGRV